MLEFILFIEFLPVILVRGTGSACAAHVVRTSTKGEP